MDVIGAIPGPVLATVAAIGAFLALRGPLSTLFNGIADAATRMAFSMASSVGAAGGFKGAMSGLAGSINPTMVALAAATLLFTSITSRMAETAAQEDKLAEAMLAGGAAALKVNDDLRNQQPTEPFEWMRSLDEWTGAAASMDDVRKKARDLYDAMSPLQQAQSDVTSPQTTCRSPSTSTARTARRRGTPPTQLAQANQNLATKQGDVKTATDEAAKALAATPAVMDNAYGSLANYAAALGLDKDATKNLIDASDKLGESLADFIDPLGTYTGLLQQKAQAEADAANKTAEKTGASSKSWEDFKDSVHVTFDEYMADLEKQVEAQNNWQTNMLLLAGRVSAGTLAELSRMGPEGAPLVADLVNRSDAELDKFDDITAQRSKEATDAWGAQLTLAAPVLAAVGKTAGQGVVAALVGSCRRARSRSPRSPSSTGSTWPAASTRSSIPSGEPACRWDRLPPRVAATRPVATRATGLSTPRRASSTRASSCSPRRPSAGSASARSGRWRACRAMRPAGMSAARMFRSRGRRRPTVPRSPRLATPRWARSTTRSRRGLTPTPWARVRRVRLVPALSVGGRSSSPH
jgi:hypothetical protein